MLESSVARIRFSFVYRTMRMQQESADWICPNNIDWKQYDQVHCPEWPIAEVANWAKVGMPIAEVDAHLRRQGYDPSTGLPVGITQQEFDARNSQYQEIAALQRPKKKLRRE